MKLNLQGLTGILTGKKGLGLIFSSVLTVAVNAGWISFPSEKARADANVGLVSLASAFLIGQGIADHGKEAEKEKNKSAG